MMLLMKRVTSTLSYLGSDAASRRGTWPLRGMVVVPSPFRRATEVARRDDTNGTGPTRPAPKPTALLRLGAVLRPALLAPRHAARVERAAHDVIAHPGQILHPAPADQHDRVLLQVVAFTRDVAGHLHAVGEPHPRHLAQRRVRLLGRGGVHPRADAPLLRARSERGRAGLHPLPPPPMADELVQ